jgi:hypothetical protein
MNRLCCSEEPDIIVAAIPTLIGEFSFLSSARCTAYSKMSEICRGVTMNRLLLTIVAATGVIFAGAQALAVDSVKQSTMSKRQMIVQIVGCMKKRMAADKSSSYNQAMKACKVQMNKDSDNLPSGALVASDTPAKP